MKYEAILAVFYTSKDCIPPGAVFDHTVVGISDESAAHLAGSGCIRTASADAVITYPNREESTSVVTFGSGDRPLNAVQKIALVVAVMEMAELDRLAEGETRSTVKKAIETRRAELQAAADLQALLDRIAAAESDATLDEMAEGETREEVLTAIDAKRTELAG